MLSEDILEQLTKLKKTYNDIKESLDLESKTQRIEHLNKKRLDEDFWLDQKNASQINKEINTLENDLAEIINLDSLIGDISASIELLNIDEDKEILKELKASIIELETRINSLEIKKMFKGKTDFKNAILTLHPGAGGTEAQDWVEMLYRMYLRWSEKKGFKVYILDFLPGDEAGIKSISFEVIGDYAYGYLKSENGVHRLIRISPFDTNKKRHTTFASLDVIPEIDDEEVIDIREEDLRIDTYRASGAGGQNVNKKDTAVRITHMPSAIVVQCQSERSQLTNKNAALKILKSKLLEYNRVEEENNLKNLRSDQKEIAWGHQIRSYVFQPYQLVKDHRTNIESGSIDSVLDGELDQFIKGFLYGGGQ
ncbi:MAG: peptide chain release factor 2 [Firmicutes bacterium]|nr:peptide chain release factor 2 [Bacillota bacterium]